MSGNREGQVSAPSQANSEDSPLPDVESLERERRATRNAARELDGPARPYEVVNEAKCFKKDHALAGRLAAKIEEDRQAAVRKVAAKIRDFAARRVCEAEGHAPRVRWNLFWGWGDVVFCARCASILGVVRVAP